MKAKQLVAGAARIAEAKARFHSALRTLVIAQGLAEKAEADGRRSDGATTKEHAPAETGLEADTSEDASTDQDGGSANGKAGAHAHALRSRTQPS